MKSIQPPPKKQTSKWTDRLAPLLPGLCSLQALSRDPATPDMTIYRADPKEAEVKLKSLSRRGKHAWFLVRVGSDEWEVYDGRGVFVERTNEVVNTHISDSNEMLEIDRDALLQEARRTLSDDAVSMIGCVEEHAGASAADHSNFSILCRRMVMEASPTDLEHFYILDHKTWPCRVTGLYADVGSLTPAMQDKFLARFKWISNSWPLNWRHHTDMLADRFVRSRSRHMIDLITECGLAAGLSGELILSAQSRWMLAPPGARYRFAQHLVETLQHGLIFTKGKAETFNLDVVKVKGTKVLERHQTLLR